MSSCARLALRGRLSGQVELPIRVHSTSKTLLLASRGRRSISDDHTALAPLRTSSSSLGAGAGESSPAVSSSSSASSTTTIPRIPLRNDLHSLATSSGSSGIIPSSPATTTTRWASSRAGLEFGGGQEQLPVDPRDGKCAVIRLTDLFSIGIGPSSSHTVGPMTASGMWLDRLRSLDLLPRVHSVKAALYGSLSATGRGHMTPQALLLGLEGSLPDSVDTSTVNARFDNLVATSTLRLAGERSIPFVYEKDLTWSNRPLPFHPNGIRLSAFDENGDMLSSEVYYSIGGGFVVQEKSVEADLQGAHAEPQHVWPYPFHDARSLEQHAMENGCSIADVAWANEISGDTPEVVEEQIRQIWGVMSGCIDEGISTDESVLPGGLGVQRRARFLYTRFAARSSAESSATPEDPLVLRHMPLLSGIDELSCYAIAVNEVNAAGGRIVTAPTNGAAGVIPAVLRYYLNHWPGAGDNHVKEFLLTSAALGMIFKSRASISAAEGGCMSEVGVATSMAAGALAACMGGHPGQVLQAAEIAMEHFLGLTCDPVHGLVQVPCIERNSFGAVKAVTAAQLALSGQGNHVVDLDTVIRAMRDTARDMHEHYKETSLGGLASYVRIPVALPAC